MAASRTRLLMIGGLLLTLGVSAYVAWWPGAQHFLQGQSLPNCMYGQLYTCNVTCTCPPNDVCQTLTGQCTAGGGGGPSCSTFPACGSCKMQGSICGESCCSAAGVITTTECCSGLGCNGTSPKICSTNGTQGNSGGTGGGACGGQPSCAICKELGQMCGVQCCDEVGGEPVPGETTCCGGNTCSGAQGQKTCTAPNQGNSSAPASSSAPAARCGNGTVEGSEECDDGNRTDGDGCTGNCTKEAAASSSAAGASSGGHCAEGIGCTLRCVNAVCTFVAGDIAPTCEPEGSACDEGSNSAPASGSGVQSRIVLLVLRSAAVTALGRARM
ncbi:MAG: hypothetical protein Greene101449_1282 [Candidatus Peregrinibacteria bacterium Greene1014_49]|nr:MAG: hypothetical protein Greene101449_1282 [Candidatus Peregrinibacteria bacterium Greene1014_49]